MFLESSCVCEGIHTLEAGDFHAIPRPRRNIVLKSKSLRVLYLLTRLGCFSNETSFIGAFCSFNKFIKKKLGIIEKCTFC